MLSADLLSSLALVLQLSFLLQACSATAAPSELERAVSIGRTAWGLRDRVGMRFCSGASGAAPPERCEIEASSGLPGAHLFERDHALHVDLTGDDARERIAFRSKRVRGVRETSIDGVMILEGTPMRVSVTDLEVVRDDGAEREAERAMRARIEGDDVFVDVEEVRYRRRDADDESFYVTWTNVYDMPAHLYALEALLEGEKSGERRWILRAEGELDRDEMPFGRVEQTGDGSAPRPTLVTDDGEAISLF